MCEEALMNLLRERMGDAFDQYLVPPPVFRTMDAAFVDFDAQEGWLITKFPIPTAFLNPYGTMQGGMLAAAVDNTFGPLSLLVSAPSVTRKFEMKFSHPAMPEMMSFFVHAWFMGREDRKLSFRAEVRSPEGLLLARANATHWILSFEGSP